MYNVYIVTNVYNMYVDQSINARITSNIMIIRKFSFTYGVKRI